MERGGVRRTLRKQTMTSSSDREVAMMMGRLPAIFVKQAGRENKRYSTMGVAMHSR